MDPDTKSLLGKLLGEIFRMQRHAGMPCSVGDAEIYGLLHGFEHVIDEQVPHRGVSEAEVDAMATILDEHWSDPAKLAAFRGFYDIEHQLQSVGVDRSTAMKILTYFAADGRFAELIAKMNSTHSPVECKTFDLTEWDK